MWMASNIGKKQLFLGALPGAQLFFGVLLSASLLGSGLVLAEDNLKRDRGFYVGGGVGQSTFGNFSNNVCSNLTNQGATVAGCDDKGFAYKAYAGYQFIRYFGVEVGYANFGKAQATVTAPGNGTVDYKSQGVFVEGVVFVPIYNRWTFLLKGGVLGWKTNLDNGGLALPSQSSTGASGMWGGGFQYMITDAFGMRAEYEYYNSVGDNATTSASHIKVISLEGLLKF
jgi:OmpA-OmpF porin, OOP family